MSAPSEQRESVDSPRAEGYRMPAEWEPHERCLMQWPSASRAYWGDFYHLAQATHAAVARAIARFEPVLVITDLGDGGNARSYCGSDVDVVDSEEFDADISDEWDASDDDLSDSEFMESEDFEAIETNELKPSEEAVETMELDADEDEIDAAISDEFEFDDNLSDEFDLDFDFDDDEELK